MSLRSFGEEISLRHLPDESDTSFSFQIPGSIAEGDLFADDGLDFFQGANISAGPPNSPPTNPNALLTLSQVTPRPAIQNRAAPESVSPPLFPKASTRYADDKMPDLKQEKPTSRAQRPKLSKLNTEVVGQPRPRFIAPVIAHLPPAEGSPAGARLEALRAQVDCLSDDLHDPSSNDRQELADTGSGRPKGIERPSLEKLRPHTFVEKREKQTRARQKIFDGGIKKTKSICKPKETDKPIFTIGTSSSTIGNDAFTQQAQSDIPKDLHGDQYSLADTTTSSLGDDEAAARLVQYSQKLITSFGSSQQDSDTVPGVNVPPAPVQSWAQQLNFHQDPATGEDTNIAKQETVNDGPLTVSQLSPRKTARPPTPTPPAKQPISPLRPSNKRPVSVADEGRQRKKSRTDASNASAGTSTVVKKSTVSTGSMPSRSQSRTQPKLTASDSATVGVSARDKMKARVNPSARAPVIKSGRTDGKEGVRHASTSAARSNSQRILSRQDTIEPGEHASSLKGKNKASASSLSSSKTVHHGPLRATMPVEFKLHTDSRLEARTRKGNPENESTSSYSRSRSQREKRPIPDFKAMHAALEAEMALRKENVHPTVPLPIKWETEERLKERHKFDEMVREKEREVARRMEEKRREREEQEERELRELRKKTIPKANEVPEWYKEAPKKKEKAISTIGR